jgi:hypothetical protein
MQLRAASLPRAVDRKADCAKIAASSMIGRLRRELF